MCMRTTRKIVESLVSAASLLRCIFWHSEPVSIESLLEVLHHTNEHESPSAKLEALTLKQLDVDSSVTMRW